jgi:hypothetical protein
LKIREILELTKTMPIAEIAKAHLSIGEKPTRAALKRAGAYSIVGQAGWHLDETVDLSVLDRSIYEIADHLKAERARELLVRANLDSNLRNPAEDAQAFRKRHSFDLDVTLVKELKLHCVKQDKKLYEAVETAIRVYLSENEEGQGV